jgi:hypothetical protein
MVRYSITIFKRLKKRRHTDVSYKEVHVPEDWGVDRLGSETITLKVSCNSESLFDKEFNINNDANKIKEVSCPVCKKKLPIQIGREKYFL